MLSPDQVVDPRPLGLARIAIGLAALVALAQAWAVMVAASGPRLDLPVADALPELTAQRAGWLVVPGLVAAVLLTLGVFSRVAAVAVAVSVGAVFAWEQQTYSSHLMLVGWLALWLAFSQPDAAWSWRAREVGRGQVRLRDQLPLMTQLSVCYLFAALAKLNAGFLSGDELRTMTSVPAPDALFPVAAVATVVVELSLACLLWSSRARPLVMAAGVALHLGIPLSMSSNWVSLSLFSLVCLALYPLFWSLRSPRPGGESDPGLGRSVLADRAGGTPQGAVAAQSPERL